MNRSIAWVSMLGLAGPILGQEPATDAAALRARVRALRVQEPAWRKIPWKTSLVEGLAASRKEHKPVLLWIFIDRPVDDARC